ncbi:MAG: hypothetical protein CFE28_13795 [Alphaproteobacteria bacterium PA2]|nr:MAG: hypothetical protein CFE28_13795 [Alphaproteobacteria bacterium PA2]
MTRLFAIAVLLLAVTPVPATAQGYRGFDRPSFGAGEQDRALDAVRGGRHVPLAAVIAQISARTPGRQLNTTLGDVNGRAAYFVQWQTPDNRVIIFIVDAQSGQIIGRQGG